VGHVIGLVSRSYKAFRLVACSNTHAFLALSATTSDPKLTHQMTHAFKLLNKEKEKDIPLCL